jgi:hypothetical protein
MRWVGKLAVIGIVAMEGYMMEGLNVKGDVLMNRQSGDKMFFSAVTL